MISRAFPALSLLCLALLSVQGCKDEKPKKPKAVAGAGGSSSGAEGSNQAGSSPAATGAISGDDGNGGTPASDIPASCGNGHRDEGEECDDGNLESGDGCSYRCTSVCESCERDTCPDQTPFSVHPWYSYAYEMEGEAEAGPKKGTARSELVKSLLQCIYVSKCTIVFNDEAPIASQISLRECFCTNAPAGTEPANYPDVCKNADTLKRGPCLDQMLAAAETDSVDAMLSKLTSLNLPLGRAFALLQNCDARVCGGECLHEETGLEPTTLPELDGAAGAGGALAAGGAPAEP